MSAFRLWARLPDVCGRTDGQRGSVRVLASKAVSLSSEMMCDDVGSLLSSVLAQCA